MRDRPEAMQAAAQRVGLLELTREVLTRAQEAGAIRPDAEAEDVPMLMCGLGTSTPGSHRPVRHHRLVAALPRDRDRRPQGAGRGRDAAALAPPTNPLNVTAWDVRQLSRQLLKRQHDRAVRLARSALHADLARAVRREVGVERAALA